MPRNFKDAEVIAKKLVETFKANATIVGVKSNMPGDTGLSLAYVSDKGLEELSILFGDVPLGSRASVYAIFVDALEREGLIYDVTQFGGTAS